MGQAHNNTTRVCQVNDFWRQHLSVFSLDEGLRTPTRSWTEGRWREQESEATGVFDVAGTLTPNSSDAGPP